MLWYLHSEPRLWWISIALDIVFGIATKATHLQEWNKNFQVIFHNPGVWQQLQCNKLKDTVKLFGHFTVPVNGGISYRACFSCFFKKAFCKTSGTTVHDRAVKLTSYNPAHL